MIQATNVSPTVWSVDELMARLDHDCYMSLQATTAVVVLTEEPDSVEATLSGDDMQELVERYGPRLRYVQGANKVMFVFGSGNEQLGELLDIQSHTRH